MSERAASRRPGPERLEARVIGSVQGVGFRWFVLREAVGLGLTGWVANEMDGSVAVLAEGDAAALDSLQAALAVGPPGARVDGVAAHRLPASGTHERFQIRGRGHGGD
jgi:acylphosphatase